MLICYVNLLYLQGIYIYLKPEDGFNTSCPYRVIKTFDGIISTIVGEEMMQRFLICPICLSNGTERYFGTYPGTLGSEFEILNDMDKCGSIVPEGGTVQKRKGAERHSIRETHRIMLGKVPKRKFSLDAFLQDGIEQMEKRPFKDLRSSLKAGDQVWIYRDKKANAVSRIMPYAHVVVYVGDDEVVHVAKRWECCTRIMMGTIKKVPIERVIKDNDQGNLTDSF